VSATQYANFWLDAISFSLDIQKQGYRRARTVVIIERVKVEVVDVHR
jgi:hypothetical protein